MSENVIEFPLTAVFERETFDECQEKARIIASEWAATAPNFDGFGLGLAMASGYALGFIRDKRPELWEEIGEALELIAHGHGMMHEQSK
jgi:hypothetical protein